MTNVSKNVIIYYTYLGRAPNPTPQGGMKQMGKKIIATIVGSFIGLVATLVLLLLAKETPLLVYTSNKVQIFFMMFFILSITATISEAVVGSGSWEVIIDMIIIIIGSIFWANTGFEFTGARELFDYLEILAIPIGVTAIFSAFFSEKISKNFRS